MRILSYLCVYSICTVCLLITSGSRAEETPEITINGADDTLSSNIRSYLPLTSADCQTTEKQLNYLFRQSNKKIQPAFRALGYYHPQIEKTLKQTGNCWAARFTIKPGPRIHIHTLDITITGTASNDPGFMKVLDELSLKKGAALNHGEYEASKQRLQSQAAERGYFDSEFTRHQLQIDTVNNHAFIQLHLDSGPRYQMGEVIIQQDFLTPDFVQHMVKIKPGEPYLSHTINRLQLALSNSNYFSEVEVRPNIDAIENLRIPIEVHLLPRKRHRYSMGAGYDTNTGLRLTANYENRRVNRLGHWWTTDLKISPVFSEFVTEYRAPLHRDTLEYLSFQAGYRHEDTDTTQSDTMMVSGRWVKSHTNGWLETRFINLNRETFLEGEVRTTSLLLVPGISGSKAQVDNTVRVRNGYTAQIDIQGAHTAVISDTHFIQLHGYSKWIHSVSWGARLLGRVELGATAVSNFSRLPTSYRFYAGGDSSVRGYSYKQLGPKNTEGDVVGGRYLAIVSAEYEQLVTENWGAAVFVDAGNAFNLSTVTPKIGAGIGLRWYSPIGLVRLDFALPLNESGDNFQIHFSMGPEL